MILFNETSDEQELSQNILAATLSSSTESKDGKQLNTEESAEQAKNAIPRSPQRQHATSDKVQEKLSIVRYCSDCQGQGIRVFSSKMRLIIQKVIGGLEMYKTLELPACNENDFQGILIQIRIHK
ncbi:hypothetical protein G9A89_016467 [Geosiphon pyriformis]|nr:hypothetical protein G9A89_016467 [Geosiphon pyriformis]